MADSNAYPPPRNAALRWLAEIGVDLPDEVQRRLRSGFFTSKAPLLIGGLNSIMVSILAWTQTGHPVFLAITCLDLLLLPVRLALLKRVDRSSGPVFATGILWACLQAATIFVVVLEGNLVLSVFVLASGFATIGGILSRNFAAPRYAMLQALMIDSCFKIPFAWQHLPYAPLLAIQSMAFVAMSFKILQQQKAVAVQAILSEIASREQSVTDSLTGLANRRGLEKAFARVEGSGASRTLLYMDLDGFKQINDRHGHAAGDDLLQQVAKRLRESTGADPLLCRLGGDEFIVLARGLSPDEARLLGHRIIASISVPYHLGDVLARVGASIGMADDTPHGASLPDLLRRADQALYEVKASGKGRCLQHGTSGARVQPPVELPAPGRETAA